MYNCFMQTMTVFRLTTSALASVALVATLTLPGCAPSQDNPSPASSVNLSHYLAVGDSYTAGVSNAGLTRASQEYSFPNLLARQLRSVAPNAPFVQPLLEAGTGTGYLTLTGFTANGLPLVRRVAGQSVRGSAIINPTACGGADTMRLFNRSATTAALPQNLGVPGLTLGRIELAGLGNEANATPGAANFNPYFERILPPATNTTYLQAVSTATTSATFFTFFQGLDDLMPYVRSGGECRTYLPTSNGLQMRQNAKKVLDVLTAGNRPGIIAQLPDRHQPAPAAGAAAYSCRPACRPSTTTPP
jgi:hypothetical protein